MLKIYGLSFSIDNLKIEILCFWKDMKEDCLLWF